jgi:hypothetical protein
MARHGLPTTRFRVYRLCILDARRRWCVRVRLGNTRCLYVESTDRLKANASLRAGSPNDACLSTTMRIMARNLASSTFALRIALKRGRASSPPLSQKRRADEGTFASRFSFIEMNIAHFQAMLKLDMDGVKRSVVERLLDEAKLELVRQKRNS